MTTIDENIINIAEDAVEVIGESNVVESIVEPTISRRGSIGVKIVTGLAIGVGALVVAYIKTQDIREQKRIEREIKHLEKTGYTVTKKIIEAEAVECEDEEVDYEGDDE